MITGKVASKAGETKGNTVSGWAPDGVKQKADSLDVGRGPVNI
jgi:hypothetical protein